MPSPWHVLRFGASCPPIVSSPRLSARYGAVVIGASSVPTPQGGLPTELHRVTGEVGFRIKPRDEPGARAVISPGGRRRPACGTSAVYRARVQSRSRRRWASVVPPQTPTSDRSAIAYPRHWGRTEHEPQTLTAGPRSTRPSDGTNSTDAPRHAPLPIHSGRQAKRGSRITVRRYPVLSPRARPSGSPLWRPSNRCGPLGWSCGVERRGSERRSEGRNPWTSGDRAPSRLHRRGAARRQGLLAQAHRDHLQRRYDRAAGGVPALRQRAGLQPRPDDGLYAR